MAGGQYGAVMTAQPDSGRDERHASPEALEAADIEAALAAHDEWVAAGCPGALSHEEVMADLLGGDR